MVFGSRYGSVYHALLLAAMPPPILLYCAVYFGWFGIDGRALPEPLGHLFEPSAWLVLPVLLAFSAWWARWILRSVPTEVVVEEDGVVLRCPLREQRWSPGETLYVTVSPLGTLVAAAGKSHLLPPIYESHQELFAALRERATPFADRRE